MRLSIINFAGIALTLVAVGTVSEASILATTRAETPLSASTLAAEGAATCGADFLTTSAGVGIGVGFALTTSCTGVAVFIISCAGVSLTC